VLDWCRPEITVFKLEPDGDGAATNGATSKPS
jgi:hypothetical protein